MIKPLAQGGGAVPGFSCGNEQRVSINGAVLPADADDAKDRTESVGAPTDIAPVGHLTPKPPHERTADEERGAIDWEKLASTPEFGELLRSKRRFVIPAMIFFVAYYFALPVLVGYARPLMERRVFGAINIAYLFALSQFLMAWVIAALYVRAAAKFDRMADKVVGRDRA